MRLSKDIQCAILLVLYLHRSGRSTLATISENLNISLGDLVYVTTQLIEGGVLTSVNASEYEYEVKGDPTVLQVLQSFESDLFLDDIEGFNFSTGGVESRSLLHLANNMKAAVNVVLKRTVRNIGKELVANELASLNRVGLSTAFN